MRHSMSLCGITQEEIFYAFIDRSTRAKKRSIRKRMFSYINRKRKKPQYRLNDHLPITPLLINFGDIASQVTVPITLIPNYRPTTTAINTSPTLTRSTIANNLEQNLTNTTTFLRESDPGKLHKENDSIVNTTTTPQYVKTTPIPPTPTVPDRPTTSTTRG